MTFRLSVDSTACRASRDTRWRSHRRAWLSMTGVAGRLGRMGLAGVALLSSACSLLPAPATHVAYQLPTAWDTASTTMGMAATQPSPSAAPLPWSVRIATPQATAPLNSRQVLIRDSNASLAAYAGIRWADQVPVLLRERLAQELEGSGRFAAVSTDRSAALADVELSTDLRAFYLARGAGGDSVQVRLHARVIDLAQRRILEQQVFTQRVALPVGHDADAVVAAFGKAVDALASGLVTWLAEQAPQAAQDQGR